MRTIISFVFCCFVALVVYSQSMSKYLDEGYKNVDKVYLKGAVPEEDGRVVFKDSIPLYFQSQTEVFEALLKWQTKFGSNSHIKRIYADSTRHEIAFLYEDELRFKSSVAYVAKSDVSFNILLKLHANYCDVTIQNIKYSYAEALKDVTSRAEDLITDKIALDKNGQLERYYDKFRVHTLDLVWAVQNGLDDYIGVDRLEKLPAFTKRNRIPGSFTALLSSDLSLLSCVGEKVSNYRIKDGSISADTGEPLIYLSQKTLLKPGEVFTLSFYNETYRAELDSLDLSLIRTPAGGFSYSESWLIVECRMAESGTADRVVGEILSIWSK